MKRLGRVRRWSGLALLAVPACLYDADSRCGPRQVYVEPDSCSCEPGYVPGESGCVPCPENEQEVAGECECVEGYARSGDGESCEPIPGELGAECDIESAPCPSSEFPHCEVTDGTSGYCTIEDCESTADCPGDYRCQIDADRSYCRRPPLGLNDTCKSDADCAGGEATFCETLQAFVCLVPCSSDDQCITGDVCCDVSAFGAGIFCAPRDACPTAGDP